MFKWKGFLTVLASLAFVLVVVNILLILGNQSIQTDVNERQQFIAQSIQLETLNRQVVAALADLAVKSKDEQLKNLLASVGINLTGSPAPAGASK